MFKHWSWICLNIWSCWIVWEMRKYLIVTSMTKMKVYNRNKMLWFRANINTIHNTNWYTVSYLSDVRSSKSYFLQLLNYLRLPTAKVSQFATVHRWKRVNQSPPWCVVHIIDLTYASLQAWRFEFRVFVIGMGQGWGW